jgi:hypothetical protein
MRLKILGKSLFRDRQLLCLLRFAVQFRCEKEKAVTHFCVTASFSVTASGFKPETF